MNLTTRAKPYSAFADALWPQIDRISEIVIILVSSWVVALSAQVTIPLHPVPVTGQTFGVLLIGALLGRRRGLLALFAYLAQGAVGLPVFAGGKAGFASFAGPTGGYLIGFLVAALVVGWLSERGWDRRFATTVLAMFAGNVVIYAWGLTWLASFVGWQVALKVGCLPFVPGDLLKILMAALILPRMWAWRHVGDVDRQLF